MICPCGYLDIRHSRYVGELNSHNLPHTTILKPVEPALLCLREAHTAETIEQLRLNYRDEDAKLALPGQRGV